MKRSAPRTVRCWSKKLSCFENSCRSSVSLASRTLQQSTKSRTKEMPMLMIVKRLYSAGETSGGASDPTVDSMPLWLEQFETNAGDDRTGAALIIKLFSIRIEHRTAWAIHAIIEGAMIDGDAALKGSKCLRRLAKFFLCFSLAVLR